MKAQKTGLLVASVVFMLAALAHVARLLRGTQLLVGRHVFGLWPSVAVIVVAAFLSVWMGMLACGNKAGEAPPQKT
jgi:hypothetical protein